MRHLLGFWNYAIQNVLQSAYLLNQAVHLQISEDGGQTSHGHIQQIRPYEITPTHRAQISIKTLIILKKQSAEHLFQAVDY